jgi:DNA invertase Pin-like site-specific DNA recombinase
MKTYTFPPEAPANAFHWRTPPKKPKKPPVKPQFSRKKPFVSNKPKWNRDPQKALAYIRVSTEEQKLGPEAQKESIRKFAEQNQITILDWYEDIGVSGGASLDKRPNWMRMSLDLLENDAGAVIIAKRDRLARDIFIALQAEHLLRDKAVKLISADGAGNGDSPMDAFMRTLLDGIAQFERAMISMRTKEALAIRKRRRKIIGQMPLGFMWDFKKEKIIPNEYEQRSMAVAKTLRAQGMSYRQIARALLDEGLWARAAIQYHPEQIRRLIRGHVTIPELIKKYNLEPPPPEADISQYYNEAVTEEGEE